MPRGRTRALCGHTVVVALHELLAFGAVGQVHGELVAVGQEAHAGIDQRSSAARTAETRAKRGRDTNGRGGDGKPTTRDEDTDTRDRGDEDDSATTNEVVLGAQFKCSPATGEGCARAADFGAIAPGDSKTRGFFFFARREQKIAAMSIVGDGADSFRLDLGKDADLESTPSTTPE